MCSAMTDSLVCRGGQLEDEKDKTHDDGRAGTWISGAGPEGARDMRIVVMGA